MKLLNRWVNRVQSSVIGLDVGSGSIKLLGLRRSSSGWAATCAAWVDIEPSADKSQQAFRTVDAIRKCLQKVPASSARYAVCGLSGPDAAVRGFEFPPLPLEAVEQAVRFEAQQVCPMEMRNSVLDYQLMEPVGASDAKVQKRYGILAAGTQQAVAERCQQVREAGAEVALLDADGLAGLNCLSEVEDLDAYETAALIDMGCRFTNVILLGANGLPFVRDLDMGGEMIVDHICEATGENAENVRVMLWDTSANPMPEAVQVALHQAVRPLVTNINETLKFYSTQWNGAFVPKVYLCGGIASVRPLAELLYDALSTEVAVFNPFDKISYSSSIPGADLLKTRGPAFVVAAGLAMRTV